MNIHSPLPNCALTTPPTYACYSWQWAYSLRLATVKICVLSDMNTSFFLSGVNSKTLWTAEEIETNCGTARVNSDNEYLETLFIPAEKVREVIWNSKIDFGDIQDLLKELGLEEKNGNNKIK